MVRWCWVNFQCRGALLIWIRVRQGPTALAVDAGGGFGHFFFSSIFSLLFLFFFGRRSDILKTEILSEEAVGHKTTNQPMFMF